MEEKNKTTLNYDTTDQGQVHCIAQGCPAHFILISLVGSSYLRAQLSNEHWQLPVNSPRDDNLSQPVRCSDPLSSLIMESIH